MPVLRDEAVEIRDKSLDVEDFFQHLDRILKGLRFGMNSPYRYKISPIEEFQAHCSNIQAFFENGLNTDILHSNIAFPLLKELVKQGFEPARKVFKEEIAKRFNEGTVNSRKFLMIGGYLDYLNSEEKQALRGYNEWMQSQRIPKYEYTYKLIILGDYKVGRSSLIEKHLHKSPGVGDLKLAIKNIVSDEIIVKLQIWIPKDVFPSHEEYRKIFLPTFLPGSNGAIVMYDITDAKTLNKISEWSQLIREQCGNIPIFLVGNKIDLEEKRVVSYGQGMALREKYNLSSFREISVETGENVDDMFFEITALICKRLRNRWNESPYQNLRFWRGTSL